MDDNPEDMSRYKAARYELVWLRTAPILFGTVQLIGLRSLTYYSHEPEVTNASIYFDKGTAECQYDHQPKMMIIFSEQNALNSFCEKLSSSPKWSGGRVLSPEIVFDALFKQIIDDSIQFLRDVSMGIHKAVGCPKLYVDMSTFTNY